MKKVIILAVIVLFTIGASAQEVKKTANNEPAKKAMSKEEVAKCKEKCKSEGKKCLATTRKEEKKCCAKKAA